MIQRRTGDKTMEFRPEPGEGPLPDGLVTSVRVNEGPSHDHVSVWNRGGLAGTLTVTAGDGRRVAGRLLGRSGTRMMPLMPPEGEAWESLPLHERIRRRVARWQMAGEWTNGTHHDDALMERELVQASGELRVMGARTEEQGRTIRAVETGLVGLLKRVRGGLGVADVGDLERPMVEELIEHLQTDRDSMQRSHERPSDGKVLDVEAQEYIDRCDGFVAALRRAMEAET